MPTIPIDPSDISPGRALRLKFAEFWSKTTGEPRDAYDRFTDATRVVAGVVAREEKLDPGPGWWYEPLIPRSSRAILFIHGGGYGLGHANAYRGLVSEIVSRAKVPAFALEYPLAPEAVFPTALNLAVETLARLTSTFDSVAVVGDSAGGGLSLATVLEARARNVPVSAVVAFSPWTDLSLSGTSVNDFAIGDPLLDPAYLRASAAAYLGSTPARDPRASPLFAPNLLLPPTLIQVGSDEVLLEDSRRFSEEASLAGTDMTLEVWQGMHHVFQLNTKDLATSRRALDHTVEFLDKYW